MPSDSMKPTDLPVLPEKPPLAKPPSLHPKSPRLSFRPSHKNIRIGFFSLANTRSNKHTRPGGLPSVRCSRKLRHGPVVYIVQHAGGVNLAPICNRSLP